MIIFMAVNNILTLLYGYSCSMFLSSSFHGHPGTANLKVCNIYEEESTIVVHTFCRCAEIGTGA